MKFPSFSLTTITLPKVCGLLRKQELWENDWIIKILTYKSPKTMLYQKMHWAVGQQFRLLKALDIDLWETKPHWQSPPLPWLSCCRHLLYPTMPKTFPNTLKKEIIVKISSNWKSIKFGLSAAKDTKFD